MIHEWKVRRVLIYAAGIDSDEINTKLQSLERNGWEVFSVDLDVNGITVLIRRPINVATG